MDHTFSDQNYSKVCKFRTYTTSHSFFLYFILTSEICTFQWLKCTNLQDELNRTYNGGRVVYVLKSALSRSAIQYLNFDLRSDRSNDLKSRLKCVPCIVLRRREWWYTGIINCWFWLHSISLHPLFIVFWKKHLPISNLTDKYIVVLQLLGDSYHS